MKTPYQIKIGMSEGIDPHGNAAELAAWLGGYAEELREMSKIIDGLARIAKADPGTLFRMGNAIASVRRALEVDLGTLGDAFDVAQSLGGILSTAAMSVDENGD
jgi:hypothetical protein